MGCAAKQQWVQNPLSAQTPGRKDGEERARLPACLLKVVVLILHTSSAQMGGLALAAASEL